MASLFYFLMDKGATLIPNTLKQIAIGAGVALLAGCVSSPIPVSGNFPITVEPKVRSAGHWGLVSNDVVKQTMESLTKVGVSGNLYVALPANPTAFDKAFQQFLITDLVNMCGRVVQQGLARRGQVDAPGMTVKQRGVERCFQVAETLTHCRGGNELPLGRLAN